MERKWQNIPISWCSWMMMAYVGWMNFMGKWNKNEIRNNRKRINWKKMRWDMECSARAIENKTVNGKRCAWNDQIKWIRMHALLLCWFFFFCQSLCCGGHTPCSDKKWAHRVNNQTSIRWQSVFYIIWYYSALC